MAKCGHSGQTRMRFLTVADRELRSAARRKATYRTRWVTGVVGFGLLIWLMWAFDGFTNRGAVPEIFTVFSVLTFLYCLFLGTARTADSISSERREGTLGLLFLTNLNSAEILAGKLCSNALASVYGLMAIFPMLALPLLMGGISFEWFGRTILALVNAIFFALCLGFLVSVAFKRQFIAIATALGVALAMGPGLLLLAIAANGYGATRPLANWVGPLSPLYTLLTAGGPLFGPNQYWYSAAVVAGMSVACLGLALLLLARTWRDRPKTTWSLDRLWKQPDHASSGSRVALRRRLLAKNPFFWLASRQTVSSPVFMVLALLLTAVTVYGTAPFFGRVMGAGTASPVLGHLFSWLWTGLAIHGLVLYYAAMSASQRLAEDKQTGALELILSTPVNERIISRGLWLAYARKMMFPALLAVLVHCFFIWILLVMAVLDPPGQLPPGANPGELLFAALFNQPIRGVFLDWQFAFIVRLPLLILLVLMLCWGTVGWVGRWLGLRMKHSGFAPMASLALLAAPPVLLFTAACYLADKFDLDRLPERLFVPMLLWIAFGIAVGHCVLLSLWAATRLRHGLRTTALSRYQPLPQWKWRLPTLRAVWRFALLVLGCVGIVAALVAGYYGYHNWRSERSWQSFRASLKRSGESLDLAPLMPIPAPDSVNFARAPVFVNALSKTNRQLVTFFSRLTAFDFPTYGSAGNSVLTDWTRMAVSPLQPYASWAGSGSGIGPSRKQEAAAILKSLEPHADMLREVASAAARLPVMQVSESRDFRAVFPLSRDEYLLLERWHLLFQVRACALLALDRQAEAAEDVLTGLRLANLARQLPDAKSTKRVQSLLVRSFQPLWEGLNKRAWTRPQLAAFQSNLAKFDLLTDYTNTVSRVVLAHIQVWQAIPDSTNSQISLPGWGGFHRQPAWQLQPRAWWFENCIQLHQAGRNAIQQVDITTGRIGRDSLNWSYINGLPLDEATRELFQESWWWGGDPNSISFAQTALNQAIIACALERFRLLRGGYPETLDPLVPEFLPRIPHDALSGRPLIYHVSGTNNFMLRGVGPNEVDDRKLKTSDDWLWAYSTNSPSAKQ